MALFLFTKAIIEGKPINVFNNGNMSRDFTYIDDIVEGVVRVSDKSATPNPEWTGMTPDPGTSNAPYRVFNIGNNAPVELMEMIGELEKKLGMVAEKNFMPMQAGDVPATYANSAALSEWVGFKPETTIAHGISEFVDWYRDYYKV
jgi:UDP-glucuronate 4-epimerase